MPSLSSLRRPLAVLAGSAALLLPLSAAAQNAIITQPAQLFAGPAPDYPVIAAVHPGLEVSVIGCLADYMWCDVMLQDGLRGWAYGPSLAYGWMGNALPVPDYGPSLGIPLVTFFVGDYWGRHYRHQPWFDEYRWRQLPPPPPRFIPPPPRPHDGWQAPYPPRWVQPGMPPRDDRRDERWNDRRDDRWRGNDQPPRRDFNRGDRPQAAPAPMPQQPPQQPPQFNQDPGRNFNPRADDNRERRNDGAQQQPFPPRFAPAPTPAAPQIAPPQAPRQENRFTPPPQPQPQALPGVGQPERRGGDGPRNRFGGRMDER
jgi:uncharacterized protein YraI